MTGSQVLLDHILLVMIALVWPPAEWRWYYPRSVRAIAAGIPGARARLYRNSVAPQRVFTAWIVEESNKRCELWFDDKSVLTKKRKIFVTE